MGAKKYVAIAVVSGLVAGVSVLAFLQQIWRAQSSSVGVLVAAVDIAAGAPYDASLFQVMKVPRAVAEAGAVPESQQDLGALVLDNGIRKGGLLTFSSLSPKAQSGSVAPAVTGDARAIALSSNAFCSPIPPVVTGDTVDIYISAVGAADKVRLAAQSLKVIDAVRASVDFGSMDDLMGQGTIASAGSIDVIVLQVTAGDLAALTSAEPGTLAIAVCPAVPGK